MLFTNNNTELKRLMSINRSPNGVRMRCAFAGGDLAPIVIFGADNGGRERTPLEGVSIVVRGTIGATVTDKDGYFGWR